MDTTVTTYRFDDTPIRVTTDHNGEPMFALADICKACGIANSRDAAARLDDDQKGVGTIDTLGGPQKITVVNESGLYDVILDSRKPEARRFRKWVTSEVLPSIRKHGGYMTGQEAMSPEEMLAASMRWLESRIAEQRGQLAQQQAQLEAQRPKVLFADAVAASDGTCLVGELAKMLTQAGFQIGQNRLFRLLRDDGYLGTVGQNYNVPKQRYIEAGLFKIKETAVTHADGHVTLNRTPKVTGKGQTYFIDRYAPKED